MNDSKVPYPYTGFLFYVNDTVVPLNTVFFVLTVVCSFQDPVTKKITIIKIVRDAIRTFAQSEDYSLKFCKDLVEYVIDNKQFIINVQSWKYESRV